MPRQKDPTLQEKLRQWAEKNRDRWYTAKYKDVAIEADVSISTVYRYYPLIVGRVGNILPSKVKEKRKEHHGPSRRLQKLSDAEIAKIQRFFDEGHDHLDIAFMTGYSLSLIERYRPKEKEQDD